MENPFHSPPIRLARDRCRGARCPGHTCRKTAQILHRSCSRKTTIPTPQELQDCELTFPIIADASGEIFSLLGLVREDAIDPAKGTVAQVPFACLLLLPSKLS